MLEKFVGSKNTVENITLALKSQRLANSILVCAEDGLGRGYFARLLAADYLYPMGGNGAVAVENGNGAEVINVLGEGASGQISAKRIREVRSAVCETSLSSTGRVVIIKNAHMMNQSSANALLKILEEPPEGVLFILCAKNAMSVMATIRSRCGIFSLCAPSIAQCEEYLSGFSKDLKNVHILANVFGGNIGVCKSCLTDKKRMNVFVVAQSLVENLALKNSYGVQCVLAKYEKEKEELLQVLTDACQIIVASVNDKTQNLPQMEIAYGAKMATELQNTIFALKQNANTKLALCAFATQI